MIGIKKERVHSEQYTVGRDLTTIKPVININKKKVPVSVELFKQFKDSLFKTAENKFLKYLEEHKGYQFEGQKHNLDKKKQPERNLEVPQFLNIKKTGKKK